MVFGNGYNGGKTRMKTKVLLNVYDLTPANDYLFRLGLGIHHSGVEIGGTEYSFAGGSGIFEGSPREVPEARFRYQVDMGSFDGGANELNQALDELRSDGSFGANDYHLLKRNCNHFCQALCMKLLQKSIPKNVNRLAAIGDCCCSRFLPRDMLEDSPVGGSGSSTTSSSSFLVPTTASMNRPTTSSSSTARSQNNNQKSAFSGKGQSLSGNSTSTTSNNEKGGLLSKWTRSRHQAQGKDDLTARREKARMGGGLLSKWTRSGHQAQGKDDLTDRRDKARMAALARLQQNQQAAAATLAAMKVSQD